MEQAKQAIQNFTSKTGRHDTSVHSTTAPSVQHETVRPTQHENINTAVDREVHQDHYHTSVQPVHDREVLPEKHHHNLGAVEHRKHDHRDHAKTKNTLDTEAAQFKDQSVRNDAVHTKNVAPTVVGEHTHHHIHETVQPVIHKETVEPHVVHTTVPIHETHHNAAQHHGTTTLPAVSLTDYKTSGGVLGGEKEHSHMLPGQPKDHGGLSGAVHNHKHDGHSHGHSDGIATHTSHKHHENVPGNGLSTNGVNNSTGTGVATKGVRSDNLSSSRDGHHHTGAGAAVGTAAATGAGVAGATNGHHKDSTLNGTNSVHKSTSHDSNGTTKSKPSLLDKLNPKVDADGDGKAGFLS